MSNYRRILSYIYAYEGGVKGKNIGYAKVEVRGDQCRIHVNVKKIYVGSNDIGVYLLAPNREIMLGKMFVRGGAGEFRISAKSADVEGSGCGIDRCYGLTVHDVESTWQCYTTIWEDAVAQAAEIELADVTAERVREREEKAKAAELLEEPEAARPRFPVSEEIARELEVEERMQEKTAPWETEDGEVETPAEAPGGMPVETPAEMPVEAPRETPADTPQEAPAEAPRETPQEVPVEAPREMPQQAPVEMPREIAQQAPVEMPREIAQQAPQEVPSQAPLTAEAPPVEQPYDSEETAPPAHAAPLPEPGDPAQLAELDRMEREESGRSHLWNQLERRYAKVLAFDYDNGCEILSIKPQDIGLLPRETWVYGNNSFLLHGYFNYRHLILAKLYNPQGAPRYLLGVPGHYFSNEKYMASMFGFPHFVLAKKQPDADGRFGYWYTDIRL